MQLLLGHFQYSQVAPIVKHEWRKNFYNPFRLYLSAQKFCLEFLLSLLRPLSAALKFRSKFQHLSWPFQDDPQFLEFVLLHLVLYLNMVLHFSWSTLYAQLNSIKILTIFLRLSIRLMTETCQMILWVRHSKLDSEN